MGFLIKNQAAEIFTAKVILSAADLLTPGFIYDIPEFAALPGYYWSVLYMNGRIINGTTPYAGTSGIHIQASTGSIYQFRFVGTFMQNVIGTWNSVGLSTTTGTTFVENDNLQIHNPGTLTTGNTELHIYIGANLIQI